MKDGKRILVLNPYIPTLGGGEKHMGFLCKFLEQYYENASIDILVHNYNNVDIYDKNYPNIDDLNKRFGLSLSRTKIIKQSLIKSNRPIDKVRNKLKIENLTKQYDLFINFMFLSKHIGKAKMNIYSCMFPPKPFSKEIRSKNLLYIIGSRYFDYKFSRSYDIFISNSYFTNHWLKTYWKNIKNNIVLYPPVFTERDINDRYYEENKKNIILSVGRFFVGAHNKKQLELVKLYLTNKEKLKDYEFHLVGALANYPQDIEYLDQIKKLAKGEKVYLHINSTFEELIDLYRKAKIFWHATGLGEDVNRTPEKMEHFGITTVEAMSYGVVPVVINKGGQTEIVSNSKDGYLWDSVEECIDYTYELINDDKLRKRLAINATKRSKDFSIEKFYSNLKVIFDEI